MKLVRQRRPLPTLNLSPLIDVIFILLIFVVLVAKFVDQERLDILLPSAEAGRAAEIDALFIELDAEGTVALAGEIVDRDALPGRFAADRERFDRAVLVADHETPLQDAVEVISTAKLAGFEMISVATRQPQAP